MIYKIDEEIRALKLRIETGQMAAYRIEDKAEHKRFMRAPFLETPKDKLRAKYRAYAAVKRAKIERLKTKELIDRRAQLIAERDALERIAETL